MKVISQICGLVSLALGLIVLFGWYTHSTTLIQVHASFVPMQYNTALGFLVCGIGLLAIIQTRFKISRLSGFFLVLLGGLTLIEYIFGADLGIDQLFMEHYVSLKSSHPGRMAPNTALCFLLVGFSALVASNFDKVTKNFAILGVLGGLVFFLGTVPFVGYLTGVETAYGWGNLTRMAVHTSFGFIILGVGLVLYAWKKELPDQKGFPKWLPLLVGIAAINITILVWQAVSLDFYNNMHSLIQQKGDKIKAKILSELDEVDKALIRMVRRWEAAGAPAQKIWQSDGSIYAEHFRSLIRVGYMSPSLKVVWVAPLRGNEEIIGRDYSQDSDFSEEFMRSRSKKVPFVSRVFDIGKDKRIFGMVYPIYHNENFEGYIVGVIKIETMMQLLFDERLSEGLKLKFLDQPISKATANIIKTSWQIILPIRFYENSWTLVVEVEPSWLKTNFSIIPSLVLGFGLLLSLVLTWAVHLALKAKFYANETVAANDALKGAHDELELRVEERTRELRLSEEKTRAVINTAMDAVIQIDHQNKVLDWNVQAEKIYGWSKQEVLGFAISDYIIPEQYREDHIKGFKHFLDTGKGPALNTRIEITALRKNGEEFPIELTITPIKRGNNYIFNAFTRDISERKKAEEELLKNNIFSELHKNIAVSANQNLPVEDGMQLALKCVCEGLGWPIGHVYLPDPENPSGRLTPSNIWFANKLEVHRPFIEVTKASTFDKGVGLPGRVLENGKPEWIKTVNNNPNFPRAPIADKVGLKTGFAFPVLIGNEVAGVMEFFSDVDKEPDNELLEMMEDIGTLLGSLVERKRGEEQLEFARQKAEKANQAKSIFISSMSHEIRTPMNAILGYAQILKRDKELSDKQQKGVDSIHRAGKHLLEIINDILDFSKIEAGKMEVHPHDFDLGSLVQDLIVIFSGKCDQKGLKLQSEGIQEGQKVHVHTEAAKLRQVLVNLIGNAVKFTDSGGVVLRVMPMTGDEFYFEVKDTGQGIPSGKLKTIFESFQQDEEGIKKGGTGLGLPIACKVVETMGGEIEVESEVGQGSRFFFTLNLPPAKEKVHERDDRLTRAIGMAPGHSVKTVLIDDNKDNLNVLSATLMEMGIETIMTESGPEGLDKINEINPDIIFVDYQMPEMNGLEVTRIVKEKYGPDKIKIVMISASTFDHHREQYMKEGVHAFVGKPFLREEVLGVIARLLEVEYEYDEEPIATDAGVESIDFSTIILPDELHASLKEMASMGMMTELEELLPQVESSGPSGPGLAAQLQELMDQFDTDGIIQLLEKTGNE